MNSVQLGLLSAALKALREPVGLSDGHLKSNWFEFNETPGRRLRIWVDRVDDGFIVMDDWPSSTLSNNHAVTTITTRLEESAADVLDAVRSHILAYHPRLSSLHQTLTNEIARCKTQTNILAAEELIAALSVAPKNVWGVTEYPPPEKVPETPSLRVDLNGLLDKLDLPRPVTGAAGTTVKAPQAPQVQQATRAASTPQTAPKLSYDLLRAWHAAAPAEVNEDTDVTEDEDVMDDENEMDVFERAKLSQQLNNVIEQVGSASICVVGSSEPHYDILLRSSTAGDTFAEIHSQGRLAVQLRKTDFECAADGLSELRSALIDLNIDTDSELNTLIRALEETLGIKKERFVSRYDMGNGQRAALTNHLGAITAIVANEWQDLEGTRRLRIYQDPVMAGNYLARINNLDFNEASFRNANEALIALRNEVARIPAGPMIDESIRGMFLDAFASRIAPGTMPPTPVPERAQTAPQAPRQVDHDHTHTHDHNHQHNHEERKMTNNNHGERTVRDALVLGAKLGEGAIVTAALDKAVRAAMPPEFQAAMDGNPIVSHLVNIMLRIGVMKSGGFLKKKWEPLGHLEEVGFYASAVEVQKSMEQTVEFLVPFVGMIIQNFMADTSVKELLGPAAEQLAVPEPAQIRAGLRELINQPVAQEQLAGAALGNGKSL